MTDLTGTGIPESTGALELPVQKLLKDWGWIGDAPPGVVTFARQVVQHNPPGMASRRTGDIVASLGLLSADRVESIMASASSKNKEPVFAILCRAEPSLKRSEAMIMAIKERWPYYARLPDMLQVHGMVEEDAVRAECEAASCLPVRMPGGAVVLLFSSFDDQVRFSQRRWMPRGDALTAALTAEGIDRGQLVYGFTTGSEITTPLRSSKKGESASDSGQKVGQLYYAERTSGDERRLAVDILENGYARKATDISLSVMDNGEGEVFYRENSVRLHSIRLSIQERVIVTSYLMQLSGANASGTRLMEPATGRIMYRGSGATFEMRCSFIPGDQRHTFHEDDQLVSISMRYLEQSSGDGYIDITKLGFEDDVREHIISALNVKRGILLLVGPTNSGKSTTLAAFLGQHFKMFGNTVKRLSLEDPKERTIIGVEQFSLPSSKLYERYLEGFLRHDPDVILLSEIRSRGSAEVATRAALTGHLVLSTFHASDPVEGYTSMAHLMSEERQHDLLQALVMIITQRLIPKVCPFCCDIRPPTESEWSKFRYSLSLRGINVDTLGIDKENLRFPKTPRNAPEGHSCEHCNSTGYIGVHPIHGILDFTKEVKDHLLRGDYNFAYSRQKFVLENQAIKALNAGLIDLEGASS